MISMYIIEYVQLLNKLNFEGMRNCDKVKAF